MVRSARVSRYILATECAISTLRQLLYSPQIGELAGTNNSIFDFCAIWPIFLNPVTYITASITASSAGGISYITTIYAYGRRRAPDISTKSDEKNHTSISVSSARFGCNGVLSRHASLRVQRALFFSWSSPSTICIYGRYV